MKNILIQLSKEEYNLIYKINQAIFKKGYSSPIHVYIFGNKYYAVFLENEG